MGSLRILGAPLVVLWMGLCSVLDRDTLFPPVMLLSACASHVGNLLNLADDAASSVVRSSYWWVLGKTTTPPLKQKSVVVIFVVV